MKQTLTAAFFLSLWFAVAARAEPTIAGTVRDPAGAPVPNVLVSFHPGRLPGAALYTETRTDENGRYLLVPKQESGREIEWSGPFDTNNFILARSFERNLAAIYEYAKTPTNLDLILQPGITVSGFVKDTQGAAISGAVVDFLIRSGNSSTKLEPGPTRTDAQGAFSFLALPRGREYMVKGIIVTGFGSSYDIVRTNATQAGSYEFPTFELKRADRILAGQVWGPDLTPLAGALVSFSGPKQRDRANTRTDGKGYFVFDAVCDGEVQLSASWSGPNGSDSFMTSSGGTGVKAWGGDTNIVILLRDPRVLAWAGPQFTTAGAIFDPSGAPVSGVHLKVFGVAIGDMTAFSDAKGKYSLRWQGQPMPAVSVASNPSLADKKPLLVGRIPARNLTITSHLDPSVMNLDLRLETGATLSGVVVDSDGKPVPKANVVLDMKLDRGGGTLDQIRTDAQGSFKFPALPWAGTYQVDVSADGYNSVRGVEVPPIGSPSDILEMRPIILWPANLRLAGKAMGEDGLPISGALVSIGGLGQPGAEVQTDTEGRFAFTNIAQGLVSGSATKSDAKGSPIISGRFEARGGDTNVLFKLIPNGNRNPTMTVVTTSGRVFDSSGSPVAGATFWTSSVIATNGPVLSDANGSFTIRWRAMSERTTGRPDKSFLFCRDVEHNLAATLEVDASTTKLDVQLQPGCTVTGSVRSRDCQAMTNFATLSILKYSDDGLSGRPVMMPTNLSAQGTFSIGPLARGARYAIRVGAQGYGIASLDLSSNDIQGATLQLPPMVLKTVNSQVAGQVIGPDGKPSSIAQVTIVGGSQLYRSTVRTTGDGHFVINRVSEGPVDVRATIPSGENGESISATVQAQAGDTDVVVKVAAK